MVGFISGLSIEDLDQTPKLINLSDPLDPFGIRANDLSIADSFLCFDSVNDWFEDTANLDMADDAKVKIKVEQEESCQDAGVREQTSNVSDSIVNGSEPIDVGSGSMVKVEEGDCGVSGNLSSIEEVMEKVSLAGVSGSLVIVGDSGLRNEVMSQNDVQGEKVTDEDICGCAESASDSSSSSSSSSNSSDDESDDDDDDDDEEEEEEEEEEDKEEIKVEARRSSSEVGEIEEGEIQAAEDDDEEEIDNANALVGWSDVEDDEDGGGAMNGPIMSKNELKALPPVPPVDVTLLPKHQMLPVGVVLSVIGAQVIVEGVEKHSPLNEGSILWITESKSPLGLIDEIFGPVKHPYYVVRYNSETEIPTGIRAGMLTSYVPEFADHVLNNNDIYKKGYDASGANDEEMSDELEFSDDEKEAEFKKMQKMTKRGMNEQKPGNNKNTKKKGKNKAESWKNHQPPSQETPPMNRAQAPSNQNQLNFLPSSGRGMACGTGLVPPFLAGAQTAGFNIPMNGVWPNGMPCQQPLGAVFSNGFPVNTMPWPSHNSNPHPSQMPLPNGIPIHQQFDPGQRLLSATGLQGELYNVFGQSTHGQVFLQNNLNQTMFGMALQGQPFQPAMNAGEQGIFPNGPGLQVNQNYNVPQSLVVPSNAEASNQFNMGTSSTRGRQPYRRGGGRFACGRSQQKHR